MKVLVTGSSGHLGEALMRALREMGHEAVGIDVLGSDYATAAGSIVDRAFVRRSMTGVKENSTRPGDWTPWALQ